MSKKVIFAGVLGWVVLTAWAFVVDGLLGFRSSIEMKQTPAERLVYEVLREHIVDPGRYAINPEVTPERRYPGGEPVFSVLYGGVGHEAAGGLMLVGLFVGLAAAMIAAWLLSQASERILSSYPRKVLFFTAIGLLLALFADLMSMGIGDYPARDALLRAVYHIVEWTLVGLAAAAIIKPARKTRSNA
ncbi:MAG: hypothetical protein FJW35_10355 [Acidobacteria bacterium]|nr:hypothetical protein [Acidobacteriota bacterium]